MVAIAYNQADQDYRREIGENQSYLKNILISPAHYKAAKARRFPVTTNMEMGSAVHCRVLEGQDEFESRFLLKPDGISFTTKEGKEWKAANKGKTVLAKADYENVLGMSRSLFELDWFNPLQEDYRKFNELSIYWDADGVPCKGRLDRLVDCGDRLLVLDLKSTDSVEFSSFLKKVVGGMNYVFQAAWYAEAASLAFNKPADFVFIGIERNEPWAKSIFQVSPEMMAEGTAQINQARKILRNCLEKKVWPGPSVSYNMLELPSWYRSLAEAGKPTEEDLF